MGKGGEQKVRASGAAKDGETHFKLDHMPTEELRKWAKEYGVNADKERKQLLEDLVRYVHFKLRLNFEILLFHVFQMHILNVACIGY